MNKELMAIRDNYLVQRGISGEQLTPAKELNVPLAVEIASAFDRMDNNPNDSRTITSYSALCEELLAQLKTIINAGYKFDLHFSSNEPYSSSKEMFEDVVNNRHLYVLPTDFVYEYHGTSNPLLRFADNGWLYNDILRAVHDIFGHVMNGYSFSPLGEENAWRSHVAMFSPLAAHALTTETRGQSSWVNFGRHMRRLDGTFPIKVDHDWIPYSKRLFAPQKIGLLPIKYSKII